MTITTRSSDFRHQIELQTLSTTPDATGAPTDTWTTIKTVRAAIWPWKGKELVVNDKIEMISLSQVRIYYESGISGKMRVKFGARIFRIDHILNVEERNRMLDLICEELI